MTVWQFTIAVFTGMRYYLLVALLMLVLASGLRRK